MKSANQIRQLLEVMVKISNTKPRSAADTVYGDLAAKALALLPCGTCGGTKQIKKVLGNLNGCVLRDHVGPEIPCPNCQSQNERNQNERNQNERNQNKRY